MAQKGSRKTLIAGILAPVVAAGLGAATYLVLTRASTDRDADFMFRLGAVALAMTVPFLLTLVSALTDRKKDQFGTASKIGLLLATLSLGLVYLPVNGAVKRSQQMANLAMSGVKAPEMVTTDIFGDEHRLSDHRGKVVLVNLWATWCPPCRKEMPELDKLYQDKKDEGLVVLGLSTEDAALQKDFFENKLSVTYPLLTIEGDVPEPFRTTARWPVNFLVDREGNLQSAPSTDQPFEDLIAVVEKYLALELSGVTD